MAGEGENSVFFLSPSFFIPTIFGSCKDSLVTNSQDFQLPFIFALGNNVREICLNLHLGKERLQITSGLSLGGGPSSDYAIVLLISLDMQLMKGTKG